MKSKYSLYIHWPFCLKKCPYCDFNSYAIKDYNQKEWIHALIQELKLYSDIFPNTHYEIQTIFFGGGTPSLIHPEFIQQILETIHDYWQYKKETEITIEVNPSSIETYQIEEFLKSGINRISIGAQSFNDNDLKFLGRLHSAKEAQEILKQASTICKNVSADFIYTLPYDTLYKWKKDLEKILIFISQNNIQHVSLYQLTIEENTQFFTDIIQNKWKPMNQDLQSQLYRYTHKIFHQLHWNQYEISNISQNKQTECQHNLAYWNYEQYLGIGPGAHSRMIINNQKYRFNNEKLPTKWKKQIEDTIKFSKSIHEFKFIEEIKELSQKEQVIEKLLMGLRLSEGIILNQTDWQFIHQENFNLLKSKGFLKQNDQKIKLPLKGKLKLNKILELITK